MSAAMHPDYLETLLLYYEEEIEGEAYFAELAGAFDDQAHRDKLTLLARVERHAAEAVTPLIARHGLTPRDTAALVASGQAEARATAADWPALLAEMTESYPGYLRDFRALEAMGPPADRARLSFLSAHEVAALAFLAREATDPDQSAAPLRDYIATAPDTLVG
jgi:transposase